MNINPNSIRTPLPSAWPQYPYDVPPPTPEQSPPRFSIHEQLDVRIPVGDGVRLAADVFLPYAPGDRCPALVSFSPYTRQLQRTDVPLGQNEAGITEFWVPRGYAHVVVDVRGSNDSEGAWDHWGPREVQDMADVIEWVASQPWCDGNIGMIGCSYFAMTQVQVAELQPEPLKAIFAYDAETDLYRGFYYPGGVPSGIAFWWLTSVPWFTLPGGRSADPSGITDHVQRVLRGEQPLDGPYWEERSSRSHLDRIRIPTYFGCDWQFYDTHLHGLFEGWEGTAGIPKRMLVGPRAVPFRPWSNQHMEALRWYDHWLKGMDSGVMEGPPIRLWIQGRNHWRAEHEWPLARTEWTDWFLGASGGGSDGELASEPASDGSRSFTFDPHDYRMVDGLPALVYRSRPMERELEITGPSALYLHASSSADVVHWHARLLDEAADGSVRLLCKGRLRSTHRALDPDRSAPYRPFHPHDAEEPTEPNEMYEYAIEMWPTSNVFREGHRIRLEISGSEAVAPLMLQPNVQPPASVNTILHGRSHPSRLLLPVIPE